MKKIISLILTCVMLSASYGVLASEEIYSQADKTAELRYELDVIGSDTVIEETPDGKKKVSVTVKNYGDTQKSATLIAAFKEKATGAVYKLDTDSRSIPASDDETLSAEVLLPDENVIDDYEFEYYVWDDLSNMIAIGNTAPHKCENFKVEEVSNSTITLSWDAAKDDAGVITYNIYCGGEKIGDTTATSFTHSGLEDDTTYSYSVEAVDGCQASSGKTTAIEGRTLKVAKLDMNEVRISFESATTPEIKTHVFSGGLNMYVTADTVAAYDKNFAENKKDNTFGFCEKTDIDGITKTCLVSKNLWGDRVLIAIPDGELLHSKTKTFRMTVLDNEAKTIRVRYSPINEDGKRGSRKHFEFNLTGSGKWVALQITLDDTWTSKEGVMNQFELSYGKSGDYFKNEVYVSDIEIVGGNYVPKENSAE